MKKHNSDARAAPFLAQFVDVGFVKYSVLRFWRQLDTAAVNLSLILCLYMKTIRAKQAKVHFAYFVQRDHHGIIAKHLT